MERRDGGKQFQMTGPQMANARRPKSVRVCCDNAGWVVAERRCRHCGSDVQKVTRLTTYDGLRWAVIWCINV